MELFAFSIDDASHPDYSFSLLPRECDVSDDRVWVAKATGKAVRA
jgi:hypothetical protein